MFKSESPESSSDNEYEDNEAEAKDTRGEWSLQPDAKTEEAGTENSSPIGASTTSSAQASRRSVPLQKRRRVTRACDECRRKKIKCDGKQPCTHCTVYSYECTYDQPSNRRRNAPPHYVEELESRLHKAETLLKIAIPEFNLEDLKFDIRVPQYMHIPAKPEKDPTEMLKSYKYLTDKTLQVEERETDALLESMVKNTGSLDLDDEGHWDFHGHSSGLVFLRRMREEFGDLMSQSDGDGTAFLSSRRQSSSLESPQSSGDVPLNSVSANVHDLPEIGFARKLCANALNDACALIRFVHQPTFYRMLSRVYTVSPEKYGNEENTFLPLLYATMALGCLFAKQQKSPLQIKGYEGAIDQGYQWFEASRRIMDITDCRDLTSLQAILFMIMFLQSSAKLSTCYLHIGIALRSAIRLGLHRSVSNDFDPIEGEVRKRVFWVIRKMDTYVGAMLGLPKMLSDDDIDQDLPSEVDDEFITADGILPMPVGRVSVMAAFNAHALLAKILAKTVKYIYPIKGLVQAHNKSKQSYVVRNAQIHEIEQDLQKWMEDLPMALRPGGEASPELARIQQLLRVAYAHTQIFLYRPFLHYISPDLKAEDINKKTYACAAACVSVSRNIIHITSEMKRRGLLVGAYWFYMYTTFFAIISLVFFVLENPKSSAAKDTLRDAYEGRDTLASLAKRSMAADKCTITLAGLFEQLPERLKGAGITGRPPRKRQSASKHALTHTSLTKSAPDLSIQTQSNESATSEAQNLNPSPKSGGQREKRASLPYDSSTFHRKIVSELEKDSSSATNNSYSPDSMDLQTPANIDNNTLDAVQTLPGLVPDLSAMMFPSADPFAYPNQPIIPPENNYATKQEDHFDPAVHNSTSLSSQSPFNQYFMTHPPYSMHGQHAGAVTQNANPVSSETNAGMYNDFVVSAANNPADEWPPQQQEINVSGMNYQNAIFREVWHSGWPQNQGYGQ